MAPATKAASNLNAISKLSAATLRRRAEGVGEIAGVLAHAGERRQAEALRDQLEDRGRVVRGVVDVAALCEGRNDDGRHARRRTPAVSPARACWRRDVVPVA